jgi:hypothetical protein
MVYDRDDPVLFSKDHLVREEKIMGRKTFGVQMLSWPQAGAVNNFQYSWLNTYFTSAHKVRNKCNVVITVDPAASRKKDSSNTAMWVVGLGDDGNYYVLDFIIDKMNLHQRTNTLFDLVLKWDPLEVRYVKLGGVPLRTIVLRSWYHYLRTAKSTSLSLNRTPTSKEST